MSEELKPCDQSQALLREARAGFNQLLADMDTATGSGMAWIDARDVSHFRNQARDWLKRIDQHLAKDQTPQRERGE